jgi:hypothetical protein
MAREVEHLLSKFKALSLGCPAKEEEGEEEE